MLNDDRAARKAAELWVKTKTEFTGNWHIDLDDQAIIVNAVAQELSKAEAEIARLQTREQAYEFIKRTYDEREKALGEAYAEIHNLRAELQHWREAAASVGQPDGHGWAEETKSLRAELASIEQFAESWPCHCGENYPGATIYHGQDCQTAIAVEFVAQRRAAKVKP